jgi:serine kinase of HPr protein (carbohydrate metabolism regulator)
MHVRLHATCVQIGATGVLLMGPSGSGKSDLALRLIDAGALLVADDQVQVERRGERLLGRAADTLAGLIEVRGVGILKMPYCAQSPIDLAVELAPDARLARLPESPGYSLLGIELPCLRLDPCTPSAAAKVRLALSTERVA